MRRFITYVVVVVVMSSAAVLAQKAKTADDMDKAMKKVGTSQQAVNKAINAMAYADAKAQVATIKSALVDAENFWVVNKKTDAVGFSKDTIAKADALTKLLSAGTPDADAVKAAYRELNVSCNGCHRAYRGVDANNSFVIKPGTI